MSSLFGLWFGFRASVPRLLYLVSGLALGAGKVLGDFAVLLWLGQPVWTPAQFLVPLLSVRLSALPTTALLLLGLWSLPFIWIGVSMSYRRALDAGLPGSVALIFFLPLVNYLLIAALCALPSRPPPPRIEVDPLEGLSGRRRVLIAAGVAAALGLVVFGVGVLLQETYGLTLFIGSPFAMGFVAALLYGGSDGERRRMASASVGQLALLLAAGVLLLLAAEGVICLAMAYPLAAVLALIGSSLGAVPGVVRGRRIAHPLLVAVVLPLLAFVEPPWQPHLREVVSAVEIDAPPEVVWRHVASFSEIPPPSEWYFKAGIAYPLRARYDGVGTAAVRYCEFSTGSFVEPITHWDEPRRLAFDVMAQPPTMQELSPYRDLEPPHLTQSLEVARGEFRLVRRPDGGTRLEGSTWYRLELLPQPYWTRFSDAIIHRIHLRVLRHVAQLSEEEWRG